MTPTSHRRTRDLVVRGLGGVAAIAFGSLWVQVHALVGSDGILPLRTWLDAVAARAEGNPFWEVPTLFWWAPTDGALHAVCAAGVLGGIGLAAGIRAQGPVLLALWALYLSLSGVGQVFLGFQWDTLLTESLFVALSIARWNPGSDAEPPRLGIWLVRLLLVKLMLGSGLVKLASGDPTWRDGSALAYHYWTQPLPNPLSARFDALPLAWHRLETWATLVIEVALSFAVFAGWRGRLAAAVGFAAVLVVLMISGNYGFFQLLSLVLVASLLDDRRLPGPPGEPGPPSPAREVGAGALLTAWLALSVPTQAVRTIGWDGVPTWTHAPIEAASPWRTVNAYGLFARMTTERPELTIEGSDDGRTWTPYVFRYKPGPLDRRPAQVAPHMPRLDWQMWFAALSSCQRTRWMPALLDRLQAGDPGVRGLFANDPFPTGPRFLRVTRTRYRLADTAGFWVALDRPALYCPIHERR